jgi:hypothetical protein
MLDTARTIDPAHRVPQGQHRGQHRRPSDGRSRALRGLDLLARLGGAVSLASLLVLGVALAGAVDGGDPRAGTPTVTVTIVSR